MTLPLDRVTLSVDSERLLLEREPLEAPDETTPGRGTPRAVVVGCFYPWERLHQVHAVSRSGAWPLVFTALDGTADASPWKACCTH